MSGATPPLPDAPSWRGAQSKEAQGQLYLLSYTHYKRLKLSAQENNLDLRDMN
jgi:hypothetical protein